MTHPASHSESEKNLSRIIVVGGGQAGLVCARELVKRGWRNVSVIESSGRPGGRTHSLTLDNPDSLDGNSTTTVELGTQTIAYGKTLSELLKDTGLEAYLRNEPLGKARNPPDPKFRASYEILHWRMPRRSSGGPQRYITNSIRPLRVGSLLTLGTNRSELT